MSKQYHRPPLVKATPLIGPVRQFTGDVLPFLAETRKSYGDAFRMRMFGIEMTCLCGDEAISLLENDDILCTSESMEVLDKELNSRLPSTFDGPAHKSLRRVHISFLGRNLENKKRNEIVSCLKKHTDNWKSGTKFDALKEAQTQTVDVLSALVVHTLIFATYGHAPKWLVLNNPQYRSAKKRMITHLLQMIARIRKDPELIENTFVGQFLDFPPPEGIDKWEDRDLVAAPLAAYLAGFDTVASAASFLLYQLLKHPEYMEKIRHEYQQLSSETDGPVDPMKQKYLRAAFQETVRINPPGALVIRYATKDFDFKGYTICKGDEILVQISGDHLNEELFPEPGKWDPTRFLSEDTTLLKRHILPFGSGSHRCTGSMLGQLFVEEMVSHWVNHFDLELAEKDLKPKVVARPFTQPLGLKIKVIGARKS
jgi:cytochrome P450